MGTTLFSCQDKDGNKKKIDKIEVVEDSQTRTTCYYWNYFDAYRQT